MVAVVAVDALLHAVVGWGGEGPADAFGQPLVEASFQKLGLVAIVDDDVLTLHPGGFQARDNFVQHGGVGHHIGPADRIQLDADTFAGSEEHLPALLPIGRAGERLHPRTHHALDGLLLISAADNGLVIGNRNHFTRKQAGNRPFGGIAFARRRLCLGQVLAERGRHHAQGQHALHPSPAGLSAEILATIFRFTS